MELRRLEYFVAVVDEESFTRAAAKTHVAQSGVSAQIRQLERELDETLLDRSRPTVRPTAAGQALLPYARAALAAVDGARQAIAELRGLVRGHVKIGSLGSSRIDLPAVLADFHRTHPTIDMTLVEANSASLEKALLSGDMDAAVVSPGPQRLAGLKYHVFVDDTLAAAVCADDPLAGQANIDINGLRERAIVTLPSGTGTRTRFETACADAGFTPHVRFEASDPSAVAQLAARGLGTAILPVAFAAKVAGLHSLTIGTPALRAQLALAWPENAPSSPAARALIACLRAAHKEVPVSDR